MALKSRPARHSNYRDKDIRDGIIRLLTDPLFADADFEEIAKAAETTTFVVKSVWDELRVRTCLQHARAVSEDLGLEMDSEPVGVITLALEELVRVRKGVSDENIDLPTGPGPARDGKRGRSEP